jgi:diguanylate cyclase (GGDEF)-like protein/PAS domain S-box-containing protein
MAQRSILEGRPSLKESTSTGDIVTARPAGISTAGRSDIGLPPVATAGSAIGFKYVVVGSAAAVIGLAVVLTATPESAFTVGVGDVATLLAAVAALLACARAARRPGPYRRGWTLFTVAVGVWTVAQGLWTFDGFTVGHTSAQTSLADVGFLGYSIPAVAALLSFTRGAGGVVTRVRGVVDALVIATSVFFISWAAVLGPEFRESDADWVDWAAGQAYPLVDAAVCSLVLFQAMRQPAGSRLPWTLLGCGMVTLAATDTTYITLTARGDLGDLGSAFSTGWVAAWLLVALAALAPARQASSTHRVRFLAPAQELVPYLPVLIALVCAAGVDVFGDPFLIVDGAAVLVLLTARQVMIIAEKEGLAVELESRVQVRTAELVHAQDDLRQTFDHTPIGMLWTTLTGVIVRVNAVFCQMMGRTEDDLVGSSDHQLRFPGDVTPADRVSTLAASGGFDFRASRVEQRYHRGDGREVWAEVSWFVTRDLAGAPRYIVGQFQDITERRSAARAKANQARFLEAVLENLDSGVVACDAEGNLTILNRALREMYSPLPLEAAETWSTHFNLFHPDGVTPLPPHERPLVRALNGEQVRNAELVLADHHGDQRVLIANGHRITDADGGPLGAVIAMHDITDRRAAEAALHRQALHDPLTDLPNRALLRDRLEHAIARQVRQPEPLALLLLDLDGFKLVNDSLGHQAGDQVLIMLANRLRSCLRPDDTIARLGGDEFAVVLENTSEDEATSIAAQILVEVRKPVVIQGRPITSDASIGIMISTTADSPDSLLRNADLAMYAAKDSGKGTVQVFTASMHETVLQRLTLEAELREAIAGHQLAVAYQPIVSLLTGRLHGFEALVRWNHPRRGTIPPVTFIPLAEATGLILPLGEWVLREACRQTAAWCRTIPGAQDLSLSVNISIRQLQDETMPDVVASALTDSALPAEQLQLEVTEGVFEHRGQLVRAVLDRLHTAGVRLAVDDFGTGYSSLSRLHSLPFDKVKIDKSFIDKLAAGEPAPMVAATIAMAHSLGLQTVAEGVETANQVPFLLLHHCDYVQGYLFGRPITGTEMEILLERQGIGTRWRTDPAFTPDMPFAEA